MPCCGEKRRQANTHKASAQTVLSSAPSRTARFTSGPNMAMTFEYLGLGQLTLVGPATGRRYSFDTPGARVAVDARDQPWLSTVPKLRLVR